MNLLENILKCNTEQEVESLISKELNFANDNSDKVSQLGFLDHIKSINVFKGFIPFSTKIRYDNFSMETYSMATMDYFYEFANFIRKYNINNKGSLIYNLEFYINSYFGFFGKGNREQIFNDIAWQTTTTDEEYFKALENNKIGDLKGKGAAQCTERSALAQQILSLFGIETYYCIGCVDVDGRQEAHCFNIVKRKNDYALLDYSLPVSVYNKDGKIIAYYPFVGDISNEEFEKIIKFSELKQFDDYNYINGNEKFLTGGRRTYVIGKFQIEKTSEFKRQ